MLISSNVYSGNAALGRGSVAAPYASEKTEVMAKDWKNACRGEPRIVKRTVEMTMLSLASGFRFANHCFGLHCQQMRHRDGFFR